MKRRHFLQLAAGAAAGAMIEQSSGLPSPPARYSLRITPLSVELAPHVVVRTTGYNGQSPGPILRMREGVNATVSITNAVGTPESVHWHGLHLDRLAGGIAPGATRTYRFTPAPSGTRWYHSTGVSSGQFGFLLIEPRSHAGAFDQEVFLAVHHWEGLENEVAYRYASFNDKLFGAGEPLRVRAGERVLFHFLHAGGTKEVLLHLPGHRFTVIALDGNPVPTPAAVDVLSLAVGERIDATVEMNRPGNWLLGSADDAERARGLALCVEYANQNGPAKWYPPAAVDWSYVRFSATGCSVHQPDQAIEMLLEENHWIVNGRTCPNIEALSLQPGRRYRLRIMNATAQSRPFHLHRHRFELTRVNQVPVSGIIKDTVRLQRYNVLEADVG